MVKTAWYDIEARGRSWNAIYQDCNTKYWKALKDNKEELAESYFRRMSIIEKLLQPYVEQMTGLNRFLKRHDKDKEHQIQAEVR